MSSQTIVTTPAVTATGTLKRTVADQIRRLNPVVTPLMSIVKTSNIDKMGTQTTGEGLINKASTDTMKFEWFTYTPIDLYAVATAAGTSAVAGAETGTATIADNTAFRTRDIVTNLTTLEVAIVNALSSTTGLVLTAVSTWSCAAGDTIAMSCRSMEEGTSDITPLTKEPDNNYNYVFPFRYPITIADTALNSPHYGGDLLKRYMTDNSTFALRNLENAFFLGKRAASETTTVTIATVAYSLYTTRGILDYGTSPIDAGGSMSFDKWCTYVFENLPNTQSPDRLLVMPMGRKIYGRMQAWANQKLIQWESGKQNEFGVQTEKFFCGPYTIKPMLHDLFDHGALANCAVIFDPTDLTYRFKTGMDVQPKDNLQHPATWGTTRAIQGVTGLQCWSGGYNVRLITGWNA
jgi:hypothetical protein